VKSNFIINLILEFSNCQVTLSHAAVFFDASMGGPPHFLTLADLSVAQIKRLLTHSAVLKHNSQSWLAPQGTLSLKKTNNLRLPSQSLFNKTVAMLFSKRSTRTRVAAETSAVLLGGRALFLGREDIQLGVNESVRDSARVIGGMCQGIFARVGEHSEIEVRVGLDQPNTPDRRLRSWLHTHPSQLSTPFPPSGTQPRSSLTS
jgi:hypothetical protein